MVQVPGASAAQGDQPSAQDIVRRQKLRRIEAITGVPLVLYATDFQNSLKLASIGAEEVQINLKDKAGFLEGTNSIPPGPLDVLLHSPGGSPTATESIVRLLRDRFTPIRFIVPDVAKSAATMLAMSGDEILMAPSAELGPIDPQMVITRGSRTINAPAQAILDQFQQAAEEIINDPGRLGVWVPILQDIGPSLRQECLNAIGLSKTLVREWLEKYMFCGDEEAKQKAEKVVNYLGDHNNFKSHGRRIGIQELLNLGVDFKVQNLRTQPELLTAIMDAYWALDVTFAITGAYKIIEHESGEGYIQQIIHVLVPQPQSTPQGPRQIGPAQSPTRQQRRRA